MKLGGHALRSSQATHACWHFFCWPVMLLATVAARSQLSCPRRIHLVPFAYIARIVEESTELDGHRANRGRDCADCTLLLNEPALEEVVQSLTRI